jgi:ferredoxin-NADP reductase
VYPPPAVPREKVRRVVFIAGGVGVNPLMSMVSHLSETEEAKRLEVRFVYCTRKVEEGEVLFEKRLRGLFESGRVRGRLGMWYTAGGALREIKEESEDTKKTVVEKYGRVTEENVLEELRGGGENDTVVYVCGPPPFTDAFVEVAKRAPGMSDESVFCEKWW